MKAPSDPLAHASLCSAASNGILPYPAKSAIVADLPHMNTAFAMYRYVASLCILTAVEALSPSLVWPSAFYVTLLPAILLTKGAYH
jgi:hypothetical protein